MSLSLSIPKIVGDGCAQFKAPSLLLYPSHLSHVGASTVKWTTLDPCSGLRESDPKLYTNFDLYEIEIHKHLERI
jgi:hypothetical protein